MNPSNLPSATPPLSVRYRVRHQTAYAYSDSVAVCQNQLRMQPRALTTALTKVHVNQTDVRILPKPESLHRHTDYFGNHVVSFAIESAHQNLKVTTESDVVVSAHQSVAALPAVTVGDVIGRLDSGQDSNYMQTCEFRFDSIRIHRSRAFANYAWQSMRLTDNVVDAVVALTKRIYAEFRYDGAATDVNTTTEAAFELKAGVCQDFAHIKIAALRSIGIPAQYVSGYLRTVPPPGKERLVGADESHAWVSAYCGDTIGWLHLDPTNACLVGTDHVPMGIGRDYADVSPMRGVALGGGNTSLQVSVDVEKIASP
jgi:transglutaminase-like putative cysteine protease